MHNILSSFWLEHALVIKAAEGAYSLKEHPICFKIGLREGGGVVDAGMGENRLVWVDNFWSWVIVHQISLYHLLYFRMCLKFSIIKHERKKAFQKFLLTSFHPFKTDKLIRPLSCWDVIRVKSRYCFFRRFLLADYPMSLFHIVVYHRAISRLKYVQENTSVNIYVFNIINPNFLPYFAIKRSPCLHAVSPVGRRSAGGISVLVLETRIGNVTVRASWLRSWIYCLPAGAPWQVT